ncbi:SEFIR domain-containing protein [Spirillospora sp. NPDC049652]
MSSEREIKIDLALTDEGGKWVDVTPNGISIGVITLRGWEIHRVRASEAVLGGHDAYLAKVNYELDLGIDPIPMNWFEIGFAFSVEDGAIPAVVVDALPRNIGPAEESAYSLNRRLHFVCHTPGMQPDVAVPATSYQVDVFGVGGNQPRWRSLAARGENVRSGSHVAWVSLFVPRGSTELTTACSVRYSLPPGEIIGSVPRQEVETFTLALKGGTASVVEPAPTVDTGPSGRTPGPRVFISYAHDTVWHEEQVIELANLLARCGVDVHMDKLTDGRRRNWSFWGEGEIKSADFTMVIASPRCKLVGEGKAASDENRGLRAELNLIRELLSQDEEKWLPRILPVVLPGEQVENIPDFLQPRNCCHYRIDNFTEEEVGSLLRAMGITESGEWPSRSR